MISVIDCGIGNIGSVLNMLRYLGIQAEAVSDPELVRTASCLILPGVGAFDSGMARLSERQMIPALNAAVLHKAVPILGVCLGMQLMLEGSEEGSLPGLGWIRGRCVRFAFAGPEPAPRIPHMAWSEIDIVKPSRLFTPNDDRPRFYFVHSYHAQCDDNADVAAIAYHGVDFTAAIERRNIQGVQFHPEKSHRHGMRLLQSFCDQAA